MDTQTNISTQVLQVLQHLQQKAASPLSLVVGVVFLLLTGVYSYFNLNVSFFGIGAPDFATLTYDHSFQHLQSGDQRWTITYESAQTSAFQGKVRHVSPIRSREFPILTHDILVTQQEFADPQKVFTAVINHMFFWFSRSPEYPQGEIHLLHVVPLNAKIYQQLLQIHTDQEVTLKGTEILKIDAYNKDGKLLRTWQDAGCNSIVITSVTMNSQ